MGVAFDSMLLSALTATMIAGCGDAGLVATLALWDLALGKGLAACHSLSMVLQTKRPQCQLRFQGVWLPGAVCFTATG